MRGYGGRLFAYLACHIGEKVDRQKVLRDIWPTATDEQARKRFHVALHELRQCLSHVMLSLKNMVENDRISIGLSSHWLIESDLNVLKMSRQHLETFPIERVDQLLDSI